ncbi:DNA polymerase III subunit psi [Pasteurella canis]|uniref:DNA polymerase III subunit psi n=1 Tax=Pasteurella canis TaxID=753 RepID=A0A379ESX1_9PAST|nr:DNA polymerase III subunit psi [Pasteurella canis]MXN88518.1 DNA polymerase III subunit psi [Pasteurella canis]UAY77978.1 DNA polymerase III subunit psi [Pasteurella canis]UDW84046.1 DNA polymerase III subunit psi [Pasteurella canis]UEA17070.1 DNA polymerase III subunit psi [Pasteurella canis]SPY33569.1 DNA polymerase III subunit psi [Pasteurella canis]
MTRRDLLLQEMGIIEWQLQHPERLRGVVNIHVDENIRLIVITEADSKQDNMLLADILRSLELNESHCLFISFEQVQHLKTTHHATYWLLSDNSEKIDRTLPYCQSASAIWRSPTWHKFKQSNQAKRQLWQQIQAST